MKIGIHHRANSFSNRWIDYCEKYKVPHKIVNCYDNDIMCQLTDCDALLWHYDHNNYKDLHLAKNILFSVEHAGKIVFPNFKTGWHFDNKISQKYLLEGVSAPIVPSYVFYDKEEALDWLKSSKLPVVSKLKGGSGSSNVRLVRTIKEGKKIISKSFGSGIVPHSFGMYAQEKWNHFMTRGHNISDLLKIVYRAFIKTEFDKRIGRERDYVYFQNFMPNNLFDIRVIVIGEHAFAIKRMVRSNDFRASGSGNIIYAKEEIDIRCIKVAFEVNQKLDADCVSYDFIFDKDDRPLIVEISYGFDVAAYDSCPGYWDINMSWNEGSFNPQEWIIKKIISQININGIK